MSRQCVRGCVCIWQASRESNSIEAYPFQMQIRSGYSARDDWLQQPLFSSIRHNYQPAAAAPDLNPLNYSCLVVCLKAQDEVLLLFLLRTLEKKPLLTSHAEWFQLYFCSLINTQLSLTLWNCAFAQYNSRFIMDDMRKTLQIKLAKQNAQEFNMDLFSVLFYLIVIRFYYYLWQPQLISTFVRIPIELLM